MDLYDRIVELARRRGFFWQSFEIYGGVGGFIDLGPLGSRMIWKLINHWRNFFVKKEGILEVVTPVITPKKIFEASGHVDHFRDPMVTCLKCKKKFRADQLLEEVLSKSMEGASLEALDSLIEKEDVRCPECGGALSKAEFFTTMFQTTIGPYSEEVGYGRPEAAQGMFLDFKRVFETAREKLPLGIAQIGKAMRNEISPRQGPLRLREFTIMEFEFFFDPENSSCDKLSTVKDEKIRLLPNSLREKDIEDPIEVTLQQALKEKLIASEWLGYFMGQSVKLLNQLGINREDQRFEEKLPSERAHYSIQTYDQQVKLDRWGWTEVAGYAYRSDFDLSRHAQFSGVDMRIFKAYEKPIEKQIRTIRPVVSEIRKIFGENSQKIMEEISKIEAENTLKKLNKEGYIGIQGFKVPASCIKEEEKLVKETGKKFTPHVVEPSFGAERLLYATLEKSYMVKEGRVVLKIPKFLAPYDVAVFPLVSKDGIDSYAYKLHRQISLSGFDAFYDDKGSIGRRYARSDEAGIPAAVTVDYQTLQDDTVTIRDRDSWTQERVTIKEINRFLEDLLKNT